MRLRLMSMSERHVCTKWHEQPGSDAVDPFARGHRRDAFGVAFAEQLRVPDLDAVERARDDDLSIEGCVLAEMWRDRDATLAVRHGRTGAREERAGSLPFARTALARLAHFGGSTLE